MAGCKRTHEEIFEKSASVRLTEAIAQAYDVLRESKNGWEIRYFPHRTQEFGGYTILAKFVSDSEVIMTSDIDKKEIKSHYAVIPETGPVLTFNSFNKIIHYFSEPGADSGKGPSDTGMGGDFEFIIIKISKEEIELKGKKSGNKILMKALKADFNSGKENIQSAAVNFENFIYFEFENDKGELENLVFMDRTFKLEEVKDTLISFRVTAEGLDLYSETDIRGKMVNFLKYVNPDGKYKYGYFTNESNNFKFVPLDPPLNFWFGHNLWTTAIDKVGPFTRLYVNHATNLLRSNGILVNQFFVGNYGGQGGLVWLVNNVYTVGITYNFPRVDGTENKVRMSLDGYPIGQMSGGLWAAGFNYWANPFQGEFLITAEDGPVKPKIVKLVNTADPNNFMTFTLVE